eukprot:1208224-Pleurochrysis_carterae.AAC.2
MRACNDGGGAGGGGARNAPSGGKPGPTASAECNVSSDQTEFNVSSSERPSDSPVSEPTTPATMALAVTKRSAMPG